MRKHLFLFFGLILIANSAFAQLTAPTGLTASQLSPTSVKLDWSDANTTETGFIVEYTNANGTSFVNTKSVAGDNVVTTSVTGLTSGATYQFRVKATNVTTQSSVSNIAVFTSSDLTAPTSLAVSQTSPSTATFTWQETSTTETGFFIEYTNVGGSTFVNTITINTANTTSANLSGLSAGTYKIRVRAFDTVHPLPTGGPVSAEATFSMVSPPAAPTNIGVFQPNETTRIEVGWKDNATDESGFELEYTNDGVNWSKINTGANTQAYGITNAVVLKNYQVRVRAYKLVSGNKVYSTYAGPVAIYIKDLTPVAPSDLYIDTSVSTKNSLTIKWKDNSNNEEGFELFVNGVSSGYIPANTAQYTVNGLVPNTDYTFQLKAYNNGATKFSGFSNSAGNRTLKEIPPAVTGLQAEKICANFVKLFWLDTSNEDSYTVERSQDGINYSLLDYRAANEQFYTDTNAPGNTTLYYRIRATNNGGSSFSAPIVLRTLPNLPAQPVSNFMISNVDTTSITLKWKNGSEDKDCYTNTRIGHQIWVRVEGEPSFNLVYEIGKDDTTLVMNNLKRRTKYSITMRSVARGGDSPFSDTLSVRTVGIPFAPTNLIVIPKVDAIGNPVISLAWKDNSEDEDYFVLEVAQDPNFLKMYAKAAPNVTYFTHAPVEEGVTWYYRVYAVNKYGNSEPTFAVAGVVNYDKIPNTPYNLKASLKNGKVMLKWYDDSIREDGFTVERSNNNGLNFTEIGTTTRNKTEMTDSTVVAGNTYIYRVKAVNPLGSSAYSNEAKIVLAATVAMIDEAVLVYPNPTSASVRIRMTPNLKSEGGTISVVDNSNRMINLIEFSNTSDEETEISLNNLREGIYLITIKTPTQIISKRIIKK